MRQFMRYALAWSVTFAAIAALSGCQNKLKSDIEQACGQRPQCIAYATQLCSDKANNCSDADHIGLVLWQHNTHIPPQ